MCFNFLHFSSLSLFMTYPLSGHNTSCKLLTFNRQYERRRMEWVTVDRKSFLESETEANSGTLTFAVFVMANRGKLHYLQKEVWLCTALSWGWNIIMQIWIRWNVCEPARSYLQCDQISCSPSLSLNLTTCILYKHIHICKGLLSYAFRVTDWQKTTHPNWTECNISQPFTNIL